ncbi:unnamed protein product [Menidia menidia]|uniref:(Atlantic silverside) hypothetical protein n=1 Tax=Menidia menidia TaxID=238744 RepID=A0A8S4B6K9_9TELE|nr:unnamed protein product [Menidia menidia]
MAFETLLTSLQNCAISESQTPGNVSQTLKLFYEKLSESSRNNVKRCKERCLEEAAQLLRQLSEAQLRAFDDNHLLLLVKLLISLQLQMVSISTACRKVDQILSLEDLQKACMLLEDSAVGREVWRESCASMLNKVSVAFPVVLEHESTRDGHMCYVTVKVRGACIVNWNPKHPMCLQIFQLLSKEVAPLVWEEEHRSPAVLQILRALTDIIFGQCCNRDTRLLAGTAVAMLISTAPESRAGGAAAWSLLQFSHTGPWLLTVGALQVECSPVREDGLDRLAVIRGLLTCCRPNVLLSPHHAAKQTCLLMEGLFPLVCALCEEKLDCHYFALEVLTLWLKRVKECQSELWQVTDARLLPDNGSLLGKLLHIIWTDAESPMEGVPEYTSSVFVLLLSLYEKDCEHFGDAEKTLYPTLLQRLMKLPSEAKSKYNRLCALLPYLDTNEVLDQYAEIPSHLLKCLSTNHLSPCGSELYKCLIQQQRRELCGGSLNSASEPDLAARWAWRWQPVLHSALTSDVALLQNNSATHLLPHTFQVFPSALDPLLAPLDPSVPGHLCAWACVWSSYRAVTGRSPWAHQDSSTSDTLQLALGAADDKTRLAALSLLCCSPKTKDNPTAQETALMRTFIPLNLNCESSPFRQHFQAAVRRFLVRIRDGCLAHVKGPKDKKKGAAGHAESAQSMLEQGVGFVEWLSELPFSYLAPGHSFQRKKTALLLLSAVLETCTDTWSPEKRKGQPPANMGTLIGYARQRGQWNFFSRTKQLALISCLEDSTNEVGFPGDIATALTARAQQLLCSPRVQEAQMGALMVKVLLQKGKNPEAPRTVRVLLEELEEHYRTAKADMLLAARTKPIHGVICALQRCVLESPRSVAETLDGGSLAELLNLLESISLLLLSVLYGHPDACAAEKDAPPSFCDMGNAISSLISHGSGGAQADGEECVLLSEEHSLLLTCCWVSLKGAVEGCCVGFTKFCATLLSSSDPELKEIPAQMLKQGLEVVRCHRSTSVTRRAAGLPMLILCVVSAEEASKSRPLLAISVQTLLDTAQTPLEENWDQTLDLPQVCAAHTLQALVRGSGLGVAVLQFAPAVAILSLTLLSSPCWAMRNAALQLYSSLCSRMLGQRSSSEESGRTQHSMSPAAFFVHYPGLQPFLLGELRDAAQNLQSPSNEGKLHLQPALYPVLTLLAQLQPGVQDSAERTPSDFLPPLLQLAASPIYSVRVMASKALVAMAPPPEYMSILIKLAAQLPGPQDRCCHNQLHGQLLQIKAVVERTLCADRASSDELQEVLGRVHASLWLLTKAQRCPLVRAVYLGVVDTLRRHCSQSFLSQLSDTLMLDLQSPQHGLQIGLASFQQQAVHFLCRDRKCAGKIWDRFPALSPDVRLWLLVCVLDGRGLEHTGLKEVIQSVLQLNLKEALLSHSVEYRTTYLSALSAVTARGSSPLAQPAPLSALPGEPFLSECLDLLLTDLEDQRGGPDFLSQALTAASLLLSQLPVSSLKTSFLQRWCGILEIQRVPDVSEVLRMACSEALCVAGVPLMSSGLSENISLPAIGIRLINTGLYLLQDQSQQVRLRAACFPSSLLHARGGGQQRGVYVMQVNRALPLLLDLLLEQFWDSPCTLEVLLSHLPRPDLRSVLREASGAPGCSSLYEQDEANVFAEPSVMSAHVLPYLLQMAEKCSQSPALAQSLNSWAEDNAAQVLDNLAVCKKLITAEALTPSWLALLMDPRLHSTLCGLFTRAALLLRLLQTSAHVPHICDVSSLPASLREVCGLLSQNGVHFPAALIAAAVGERPL